MQRLIQKEAWAAVFVLGLLFAGPMIPAASAVTFDSGSTCVNEADPDCLGPFAPSVNEIVALPPDGILDYTTFTIPYGVTVTFTKNAANTPVIIRTTGNVLIEGTISVSGTSAASSGTYGDGNLGDDGQPGLGGPGGFDGGYGGYSPLFGGASGQKGGGGSGPGGGQTGTGLCNGYGAGGGGGGFGAGGTTSLSSAYCGAVEGSGGSAYGQATLLPLVGGSGGGGGAAGSSYNGSGGGGGGGAIMISAGTSAVPAIITVGKTSQSGAGRIYADGGIGGASSGSGSGGGGGGGSGGAIRLVADTLKWLQDGLLQANAGGYGTNSTSGYGRGGDGGAGIIRLEANTVTGWLTSKTSPAYSTGLPGHVLVPDNPTLVISSVTPTNGDAVSAPANPTGNADITFPEGTTSATVTVAASYIPRGTTVTIYVVPSSGAQRTSALTNALDGVDDSATTATATITLSPGNNVLLASATYTVTEIVAMNLPTFDNGVRVAKVRVDSTMGGESKVTYITASGKEYPADSPRRDKPGKGRKA
jgi:hypothetical protein